MSENEKPHSPTSVDLRLDTRYWMLNARIFGCSDVPLLHPPLFQHRIAFVGKLGLASQSGAMQFFFGIPQSGVGHISSQPLTSLLQCDCVFSSLMASRSWAARS